MRGQQGLSVIELLIVAGVVTIATSILVPEFRTFLAHARQAEAKSSLALVRTLELSYAKDNGAFTESLPDLGFKPVEKGRYQISVPAAGESGFTGLAQAASRDAIANGCGTRDTWQIDEQDRLVAVSDCAAR